MLYFGIYEHSQHQVKELYGDCSLPSVLSGNRMAETVSTVLLPLMDWLSIYTSVEKPESCLSVIFMICNFMKNMLCINISL